MNPYSAYCIELCTSLSGIEPLEFQPVRLLAWCPYIRFCCFFLFRNHNFSIRVLGSTGSRSSLDIKGDLGEVSGILTRLRLHMLHLRPLGDATKVLELLLFCPCAVIASLPKPVIRMLEKRMNQKISELSEDEDIGTASHCPYLTEHEASSAEKKQLKKTVSKLVKAIHSAKSDLVEVVIDRSFEVDKELALGLVGEF